MHRLATIVIAVATIAAACGSEDDGSPALEQAFLDAMTEQGVPDEAAQCLLDELEAEGYSATDLAIMGLSEEEPPPEMLTAIFRCGEELLDDGAFGGDLDDDSDGPSDTADAYGDDPFLDGLHDACTAGDMQACDDLYWQSPIGSEYEAFGDTCGNTVTPAPLTCTDTSTDFGDPPDTAHAYGDDPFLDDLHNACTAGDMQACDDLYWASPIGSEYEAFGDTCGNTVTPAPLNCTGDSTDFGQKADAYGDDPFLDDLHDDCAAGDMQACDDLYWQSPIGSEYEAFGDTCGNTIVPAPATCTGDPYPFDTEPKVYGDDPFLDDLHDDCAAGDMQACDDLYWQSPIGSEYEAFAATCGERSELSLFGDCAEEFGSG